MKPFYFPLDAETVAARAHELVYGSPEIRGDAMALVDRVITNFKPYHEFHLSLHGKYWHCKFTTAMERGLPGKQLGEAVDYERDRAIYMAIIKAHKVPVILRDEGGDFGGSSKSDVFSYLRPHESLMEEADKKAWAYADEVDASYKLFVERSNREKTEKLEAEFKAKYGVVKPLTPESKP